MTRESMHTQIKGNDLARWIVVIVLAIALFFAVWYFLKRSEKPAKNNPDATTEVISSSPPALG